MTSVRLYVVFIGLLYGQRLAELIVSRRHARRAFALGGVEHGRAHYPVMVVVHGLFPLACVLEVLLLERRVPGALGVVALGAALVAQVVRWWSVATLGWRWNTRIIVVPGVPPVTSGPFRYLRHPNYLAVLIEVVAIPIIHGAWLSALVFTTASAALFWVRIPAEERALGAGYTECFAGRPRLLPGVRRA